MARRKGKAMRVEIISKGNSTRVANLNRRSAIRERCLNCNAWSYADVKRCKSDDCPLHSYRLGGKPHSSASRAKAIREYCLSCCGTVKEVRKCTCTTCPLYPYRNTTLDKSLELPSSEEKRSIEQRKSQACGGTV